MTTKKFFLITFSFFFLTQFVFAKKAKNLDLSIQKSDILITAERDENLVKDGNGVHLFVKKTGDIQSIALVRTGGNGSGREILRAGEYNPINGDEKIRDKGKKMNFSLMKADFALIATKTERHEILGECFHIYIPQKVFYGFLPSAKLEDFSFKNLGIRTYAMPHCDYSSEFRDFSIDGSGDVESEVAFLQISSTTGGKLEHIERVSELTEKLLEDVDELDSGEKIELIFAIDATESMKDDFAELRKNWLPRFEKQVKKFSDIKIGLLLYKDYGDEYKTNGLPVKNLGFLKNASAFSKAVKSASVKGGGDREEAVYEALYSCATGFAWSDSAKKKVILVGDAPPHKDDTGDFALKASEILAKLSYEEVCVDCFLISDSAEKVEVMKSVEKSNASGDLLNSVEMIDAK